MPNEINNNYIKYINNLIIPYNIDHPQYKNLQDQYYYTNYATNGQLKRLQKKNSDFNYIDFLQSDNQVLYFKNFIINKTPTDKALNMRLMYIKKELRNIDWLFLSNSGMLQDQFITLILTKSWMIQNGLIDETQIYIPIKIIHYLCPKQLCKSHDLLKIVKNIYFENEIDEYSSSSSDQNDSSIQQLNEGTLLQKILRILHEDRIQYSKNALYDSSSNTNRFIETSYQKDNTVYDNNLQICIFDDFVQFIKTTAKHSQNNSSYYSKRYSDQEYLIQNVEQPYNSYVGYNYTIPKPILNFSTLDKKFTDLYNELTYEYTENKDGITSSSPILSTPKMHIVDQYRTCGIDRISLLKHQDNLPLDFVCKYYYMDEICKYYRFTPKQLLNNYDGLIITYKNQNNDTPTPLDFKLIFTYNSFDMQNNDMKMIYNRIINDERYTNDIDEIKNIIYLYQRIVNREIIQSSNSSFLIDESYSSLIENHNINRATLQQNNGKFEKHIVIKENNNYNYNFKKASLTIQNTDDFTDNLLLINLKNDDYKASIIQSIQRKTEINNSMIDYCLFRYIKPIVRESMRTNYLLQNLPIPIMDIDENGHYLNLCVRCHESQFFYVNRGTAIQSVLRPSIPLSIQTSIENNDFYYPNNRSCDNNGYITCGLYDMLTQYTDCYTILKAKVYIEDIIAILDNGLIACNKVKIVDPRIYHPKYNIGLQSLNDTTEPYKIYIYKQTFK